MYKIILILILLLPVLIVADIATPPSKLVPVGDADTLTVTGTSSVIIRMERYGNDSTKLYPPVGDFILGSLGLSRTDSLVILELLRFGSNGDGPEIDSLLADSVVNGLGRFGGSIYGELYIADDKYDTTMAVTPGTYYPILNDEGYGAIITGDTTGILAIPDSCRFVVKTAGIYSVWVTASFAHTDAQTAVVEIQLFKNNNGTPVGQVDLEVHRVLANNDVGAGGFSGLINLSVDDTLDLRIASQETSDNIIFHHVNFGLFILR